jgi:uncharacterized membrane protein YeiH
MIEVPGNILPALPAILNWLDFAGVAVFAVTGALVAARTQQDVIVTAFFSVLTGLGGGTVRDLLIGAPVFWIGQRGYLEICLIAAVGVFIFDTGRRTEALLNWADAIGLSVYCVIGTIKALAFGAHPAAAAAMGVVTASVGGIMRDVLGGRPSVLMQREFYVTSAVAGAGLTTILIQAGMTQWVAGCIAAVVAFITRAGAILFGWKQPVRRG